MSNIGTGLFRIQVASSYNQSIAELWCEENKRKITIYFNPDGTIEPLEIDAADGRVEDSTKDILGLFKWLVGED